MTKASIVIACMARVLRIAQHNGEPSGMLTADARRFSLRATQHAMTRTRVDSGRHAGNGASRAPRTGPRTPHVLAVRHAVEMLRCLASDTPLLGVSEIASVVGMHKSSVSRMVATLEEDGLVERDPASKRIRLGPGLLSLAAPLLARVRVVETAQPQLVELAQRSGETISISVWDGAGAVNLAQVLGGKAVKHYAAPGSRNPAHASASGKLLLAFASAETADRILRRELRRFTPRTLCTRSALLAEIATIRRQGYAVNEGELSLDVGGLAAAIRNDNANVVAAITATVPMYRFAATNRRQLVELVRDAADRVSARLGYARADHHANR